MIGFGSPRIALTALSCGGVAQGVAAWLTRHPVLLSVAQGTEKDRDVTRDLLRRGLLPANHRAG